MRVDGKEMDQLVEVDFFVNTKSREALTFDSNNFTLADIYLVIMQGMGQ